MPRRKPRTLITKKIPVNGAQNGRENPKGKGKQGCILPSLYARKTGNSKVKKRKMKARRMKRCPKEGYK